MGKGRGPAPENLGGTAIKPVGWDRTGMEAFKYFLYNPDTGEFLSRTPLSWLKITVFYTIYYSCLAGFWALCLYIFFQTLPPDAAGPKFQQDYSLIKTQPGVGIRPRNTDKRIDSQMFVLLADDDRLDGSSDLGGECDDNACYAKRVDKFMEEYNKTVDSSYHAFEKSTLGDCKEFPYGFVLKDNEPVAPCVFLKLNRIWGWTPQPIKDEDLSEDLDEEIAEEKKVLDKLRGLIKEGSEDVLMNCEGRNAADKEALEGRLTYFPPNQLIPNKYFPYEGGQDIKETHYHSPLVAVKINPKPEHWGQLLHIECRAYYGGVKHNAKDKKGLAQFEVLIGEKLII